MQDFRLKCQLSSSKQERKVFLLRHQPQVVFSPRIPINSSSLTLHFPVEIYLLQFLLFVQHGLHTLWVSEGLIISRLHAGLEFSLLFPSTLSTLSLCFSYQTFFLIKNFFYISDYENKVSRHRCAEVITRVFHVERKLQLTYSFESHFGFSLWTAVFLPLLSVKV